MDEIAQLARVLGRQLATMLKRCARGGIEPIVGRRLGDRDVVLTSGRGQVPLTLKKRRHHEQSGKTARVDLQGAA